MNTIVSPGPLSLSAEFARRAAVAWIRAADAGVIDADELSWLLRHLPAAPSFPGSASTRPDPSR